MIPEASIPASLLSGIGIGISIYRPMESILATILQRFTVERVVSDIDYWVKNIKKP
jgi:hypothetical protein